MNCGYKAKTYRPLCCSTHKSKLQQKARQCDVQKNIWNINSGTNQDETGNRCV